LGSLSSFSEDNSVRKPPVGVHRLPHLKIEMGATRSFVGGKFQVPPRRKLSREIAGWLRLGGCGLGKARGRGRPWFQRAVARFCVHRRRRGWAETWDRP